MIDIVNEFKEENLITKRFTILSDFCYQNFQKNGSRIKNFYQNRGNYRDLAFISISIFFWGFGYGLYINIFPLIALSIGANTLQVAAIYSLSYFITAFSPIPGGIAADSFSRKKIMLAGWAIATPSALIFAYSETWLGFVIGEILYCISNFCAPALSAFIASRTCKNNACFIFSFTDVSSSIAMIISPAIGGFFAALFGIKFVFLLSFLSYLISTSFIFLIEEDRNIYRNFSNVENGMNSKWEKKIRPMQDYLPLLQDKKFLRICMLFSLVFLSIYISHPFVPIYIYDVYKMPMSLIGVLGTASALGGVAISLLFSRIADRINKYRAIAFLLLISFISTLMLILSANFTILLFTFFLSGSAFSFYGIMSGLVVTKVSKQNSGKAFAVLETVTGIPVIIAPIIGSILYSYAPILPILATIIISLIVILILFFIPFLD